MNNSNIKQQINKKYSQNKRLTGNYGINNTNSLIKVNKTNNKMNNKMNTRYIKNHKIANSHTYSSYMTPTNINTTKLSSTKSVKRVFELVDYPTMGDVYGNYSGSSPGQAAKKMFNYLAKKTSFKVNDNKKSSNTKNAIIFSLREKGVNSSKKYEYLGTRTKLIKPTVITYPTGKKVEFKYKTLVTKHKKTLNSMKGGSEPHPVHHHETIHAHNTVQNHSLKHIHRSILHNSKFDHHVHNVPIKSILTHYGQTNNSTTGGYKKRGNKK